MRDLNGEGRQALPHMGLIQKIKMQLFNILKCINYNNRILKTFVLNYRMYWEGVRIFLFKSRAIFKYILDLKQFFVPLLIWGYYTMSICD